jgi:hypothetical protein
VKRRPRKMLKLFVFLLAGAIINVAIAWGCAWAFDPFKAVMSVHLKAENGVTDSIGVQSTFGHQRLNRFEGNIWDSSVAESPDLFAGLDGRGFSADFSGWPVASFTSSRPGVILFYETDRSIASGRPNHSVSMERGIDLTPAFDAKLGSSPAWGWRALPLHPIFPGFAINTIFYAAVLWVLFAVPGRVRRWRRIKRGVCVHCAYPVGTSFLCSECGTAVHGAPPPATPV